MAEDGVDAAQIVRARPDDLQFAPLLAPAALLRGLDAAAACEVVARDRPLVVAQPLVGAGVDDVPAELAGTYDARTRLSAQVADEVRSHFTDQVLKATIPRSVRISEAPSHGQTVLTYDPSSSGALSYAEAAKELAARSTTIAG